jgi:hypothetical protein
MAEVMKMSIEVDEKELKERKAQLQKEINKLELQFQQAQQIMQSAPLLIAGRRGEIIGIDRSLNSKIKKG